MDIVHSSITTIHREVHIIQSRPGTSTIELRFLNSKESSHFISKISHTMEVRVRLNWISLKNSESSRERRWISNRLSLQQSSRAHIRSGYFIVYEKPFSLQRDDYFIVYYGSVGSGTLESQTSALKELIVSSCFTNTGITRGLVGIWTWNHRNVGVTIRIYRESTGVYFVCEEPEKKFMKEIN